METGLRYEDALDEATDYIMEHRTRGNFHAAKTVLERTPGSPYCRDKYSVDTVDSPKLPKIDLGFNIL